MSQRADAQSSNEEPAIGSRWSVQGGKGFEPNVYELVSIDPKGDRTYPFVLRLVSTDARAGKLYRIGGEIRVERMWFVFRGGMGNSAEGSVRRVA